MTRTRGRDGAHLYSSPRPSLCNCLCASELETSMDVEKRFLSFFLSFFFLKKLSRSYGKEICVLGPVVITLILIMWLAGAGHFTTVVSDGPHNPHYTDVEAETEGIHIT